MISAIIPVKDRANSRIQRCIDSIKLYIDEIIVIDYGSKTPVKLKGAKIIRFTKSAIWNKSHALNIGIKKSKGDFIMAVDCDIIIPREVMESILGNVAPNTLIVDTNVRRIKVKDVMNPDKSWPWSRGDRRIMIYSRANGGFQLFPRDWIFKVRGYDENLIYWGGIDNDLYERAYLGGLTMVDINLPIFHQEHPMKEANLKDPEERDLAEFMRMERSKYLSDKLNNRGIVGPAVWGVSRSQTRRMEGLQKRFKRERKRREKERKALLSEISRNIEKSKKEFKLKGTKYKIFYPDEK